tara:strand:+ start:339 stop:815 length:477 start_codon:yes stop_codon:yes gene_type:complete
MSKKINRLINILKKNKKDISVAESCTGGKLSGAITSISGSSKVFKLGLITYSNKSKIEILKIKKNIIKKYGAVSKECCESMLINLSKIAKTSYSIAITGIAGPSGGTKKKPVGLVFIGIRNKKNIFIKKCIFKEKRRVAIQNNSVKKAIDLIFYSLKN